MQVCRVSPPIRGSDAKVEVQGTLRLDKVDDHRERFDGRPYGYTGLACGSRSMFLLPLLGLGRFNPLACNLAGGNVQPIPQIDHCNVKSQ